MVSNRIYQGIIHKKDSKPISHTCNYQSITKVKTHCANFKQMPATNTSCTMHIALVAGIKALTN